MFENFISIYKKNKTLVLSIIGLVAILLPVVLVVKHITEIAGNLKTYPYIGADIAYKNTISVNGEGRVYTKPDIALINLSVVTEGASVKIVQNKNTEKMNKVIKFLKDFGVAEKDIKTINYQLYPRYSYEDRKIPQIIGYEISQTLEIKIRDLDKIGEILEGSTGVGINQISSLQFKVDDDEKIKEEARTLAIEDAKAKAKKLASQLGIRLIKISGYSEGTGFDYPAYREFGIGGGGETPRIEVGENEIIVNVILIYEID